MNWSAKELETIDLSDARLNTRCQLVLERLMSDPAGSIPVVCQGTAETQAAYRLFDNDKTTQKAILEAHRDATLKRASEESVLLVIQDTSEFDFSRPNQAPAGAGPLNYNGRDGFLLHPQYLVTAEGLPLGTVDFVMWGRDSLGKKKDRKQRSFEEKESRRWVDGYEVACDVARELPDVEVISVSDAESDIYECFIAAQTPDFPLPPSLRKARFIIRACQNRCLTERDEDAGEYSYRKIQQALDDAPILREANLTLPKTPHRDARVATVEICSTTLRLKPPHRNESELPEVQINAIRVREINCPQGETSIEWTLLTDLPVDTIEDVQKVIEYYARRWQIEVFFRVLKTGCRVEELQLKTQDRLEPCLALYMIVAWRVMYLTLLGRECPELPCDTLFADEEWKSVWKVVTKNDPPQTPPTLGEFIPTLATLGGYLGRKHDGPPGPKAIWIGIRRATDFGLCWKAFGPADESAGGESAITQRQTYA